MDGGCFRGVGVDAEEILVKGDGFVVSLLFFVDQAEELVDDDSVR